MAFLVGLHVANLKNLGVVVGVFALRLRHYRENIALEGVAILITVERTFGGCLINNLLHLRRHSGVYRRGRRQGVVDYLVVNLVFAEFVVVGMLPRQHLEKRDAERVDVGAAVEGLTLHLLRTHIQRRANLGAGLGDVWRRHIEHLRNAKIKYLDLVVGRDDKVARLDVAVYDVARVHITNCIKHLEHIFDSLWLRDGTRFVFDVFVERRAVDEFFYNKSAFITIDEIVDCNDVRMFEF